MDKQWKDDYVCILIQISWLDLMQPLKHEARGIRESFTREKYVVVSLGCMMKSIRFYGDKEDTT